MPVLSFDILQELIEIPGFLSNDGLRIVEEDGGVDDEVRAAAGGLESIINGSILSSSANMTPSVSQKSMHRVRVGKAPENAATATSFDPVLDQSAASSSGNLQGEVFLTLDLPHHPTLTLMNSK